MSTLNGRVSNKSVSPVPRVDAGMMVYIIMQRSHLTLPRLPGQTGWRVSCRARTAQLVDFTPAICIAGVMGGVARLVRAVSL